MREGFEIVRWRRGILGAIEGQQRRRDRSRIRLQEPTRHEGERRLAPAVVTDDARPPPREGGGHGAQGGFGRRGVGVFDVGEVELHHASGCAKGSGELLGAIINAWAVVDNTQGMDLRGKPPDAPGEVGTSDSRMVVICPDSGTSPLRHPPIIVV